jgi:hypothetical protein
VITNFWEEKFMGSEGLSKYHEKELLKMEIPGWMTNIKCPFCGEIIGVRGIRNIRLCLNTRNLGDLSIEVLCEKCMKLDTVYYRERLSNITAFVSLLTNSKPKSEPILEENMYKMQYNNAVENMLKESGGEISKISISEKEKENGNI